MLQAKLKNDHNYSYIDNKKKKSNENKNNFSSKGFILCLLAVIIVGTVLLSYIYQYVQITHLNYKINTLEDELNKINEEKDLLNVKVAKKMSIARIEKIARNDLNMVEPEKIEIVILENEVEKIDNLPKNDKVFFVRIFNDLIERIGTVQAEELP